MRLDEEKLEALRTWGQGLRQADNEELAATGRAILMLVDEIDRLQIDLWHARLEPSAVEATPTAEIAEVPEIAEPEPVTSSLHSRLRRVLRRDPGSAESAPPDPETEAASPQAWIEALRRQGQD